MAFNAGLGTANRCQFQNTGIHKDFLSFPATAHPVANLVPKDTERNPLTISGYSVIR
jgi:hypothetical protein